MMRFKLAPSERLLLIGESGLVCMMTSMSGAAYLVGDISKRLSGLAYGIGAQIDTATLEIFESMVSGMEKYIWKELNE